MGTAEEAEKAAEMASLVAEAVGREGERENRGLPK